MDPSLLAALTAGWQPPPLPLGLGQLPPPTPGPWRPTGLAPLPQHMMLPPAVMLMHVQASGEVSVVEPLSVPDCGFLHIWHGNNLCPWDRPKSVALV